MAVLNTVGETTLVISSGIIFQNDGPQYEYAFLPVDVRNGGSFIVMLFVLRVFLPISCFTKNLDKLLDLS